MTEPYQELTSGLFKWIEQNPSSIRSHLHNHDLEAVFKYHIINLGVSLEKLMEFKKNHEIFLNMFAMICRGTQETTANIFSLLNEDSKEKIKNYCENIMHGPCLLEEYHAAIFNKEYKHPSFSWTKGRQDSYSKRIKRELGSAERVFYKYICALTHFEMPNEGYLETHPQDLKALQSIHVLKVCKYTYLTVKKAIDFNIFTDSKNPKLAPVLKKYIDEIETLDRNFEETEHKLIDSLQRYEEDAQLEQSEFEKTLHKLIVKP